MSVRLFSKPLELKIGTLQFFPDAMRHFQRDVHDCLVLDGWVGWVGSGWFCLVLFFFVWFCLVFGFVCLFVWFGLVWLVWFVFLFGFVWFCFFLFGFVWFCVFLFGFVSFFFCLVLFGFSFFCLVWFGFVLFVLFCFVSFRFVLFVLFGFVLFCLFCFVCFVCFILFCFVSFCFVCFVLFCYVMFCFVMFVGLFVSLFVRFIWGVAHCQLDPVPSLRKECAFSFHAISLAPCKSQNGVAHTWPDLWTWFICRNNYRLFTWTASILKIRRSLRAKTNYDTAELFSLKNAEVFRILWDLTPIITEISWSGRRPKQRTKFFDLGLHQSSINSKFQLGGLQLQPWFWTRPLNTLVP